MARHEEPYKVFRLSASVKGKGIARKLDRAIRQLFSQRTTLVRPVKETDTEYEARLEFYDPGSDPDALAITRGLDSSSILPRNPRDRPRARIEAEPLARPPASAPLTPEIPDKPKTVVGYEKALKALESQHRQDLAAKDSEIRGFRSDLETARQALAGRGEEVAALKREKGTIEEKLRGAEVRLAQAEGRQARPPLDLLLDGYLAHTGGALREAAADYEEMKASGNLDLFLRCAGQDPPRFIDYAQEKYQVEAADEGALELWAPAFRQEAMTKTTEYRALDARRDALKRQLEQAREDEALDVLSYLERTLGAEMARLGAQITDYKARYARRLELAGHLDDAKAAHARFCALLGRAAARASATPNLPALVHTVEGPQPSLDLYLGGIRSALAEYLISTIVSKLPTPAGLAGSFALDEPQQGILKFSASLMPQPETPIPSDPFTEWIPYIEDALAEDEVLHALSLRPAFLHIYETRLE